MATKTFLTVQQFTALEEPAGVRYELSNGELIVTPSASHFQNKIRDRFTARLQAFLDGETLGEVSAETDVKLIGEVVRRPDVAFFRAQRLVGVDPDQSPFPVWPDLVIEIVSKNDRADDLLLKVSQYLQAGAQAVWLMHPHTGVAYRYVPNNLEPEVRTAKAGDSFEERDLIPGFSLPLHTIFS
jgi:Uma2 family endonuclease